MTELSSFFNESKIFMIYASGFMLVIAFTDLVAPKGAVCFMRDVIHFMLALRGFGGPTECPWA